ncbi:MAG: hypothetical protein K1000chlam2_01455 [Chlamydiae bacterium]|nr:hypothetical protein [Chlamydiota bacterium]
MKISSTLPPREVSYAPSSHQRCDETRYHSNLVSLKLGNPFYAVWKWVKGIFLKFCCCYKQKSLSPAERAALLAKFKDFVRDHWNQEGHSYTKVWNQLDPITRQALIEKSHAAMKAKARASTFEYSDKELFNGAVDFISDPLKPNCDVLTLVFNQKNYFASAQELLFNLIDQVASDGAPT